MRASALSFWTSTVILHAPNKKRRVGTIVQLIEVADALVSLGDLCSAQVRLRTTSSQFAIQVYQTFLTLSCSFYLSPQLSPLLPRPVTPSPTLSPFTCHPPSPPLPVAHLLPLYLSPPLSLYLSPTLLLSLFISPFSSPSLSGSGIPPLLDSVPPSRNLQAVLSGCLRVRLLTMFSLSRFICSTMLCIRFVADVQQRPQHEICGLFLPQRRLARHQPVLCWLDYDNSRQRIRHVPR